MSTLTREEWVERFIQAIQEKSSRTRGEAEGWVNQADLSGDLDAMLKLRPNDPEAAAENDLHGD